MTKSYSLTGMTCTSCESKVKSAFLSMPEILAVNVSLENETVTLSMLNPIPIRELQGALSKAGDKYSLLPLIQQDKTKNVKAWFITYKPILLIFSYIGAITILLQLKNDQIDWMQWMNHFMAGFFLVFSFFKILNLKGFADSYQMYDVIARRIPIWAYMYAFLELGLGIAILLNFYPLLTHSITFIVMSISIIGVLQSVLNKRKIQCACLGDVFNLPMSTVTIIEDALMIIMSALMILDLI